MMMRKKSLPSLNSGTLLFAWVNYNVVQNALQYFSLRGIFLGQIFFEFKNIFLFVNVVLSDKRGSQIL